MEPYITLSLQTQPLVVTDFRWLIGSASYLTARLNSLQGETYLTELLWEYEPRADAVSIPISVSAHNDMEGFQVAVSSFGLRALRIIYADASTSSWLGKPADCWLGMAPGTSWNRLEIPCGVCVRI